MLSPDDRALIARDPDLPGLETLLDEEAMMSILRGLSSGPAASALRARYVRYKPATSCIVGYDAELAGRTVPLYARTHRADARVKLAKVVRRARPPGIIGFGVAALPDRHIVLLELPNDDELNSLPKLIRAEGGELRGADVTLGDHSLEGARITPLRYKPERRFVARIDREGRRQVLKVYAREDFEAIRRRGKQFATSGPLIVAEPVGSRTRHRALLFDWIEGESLLEIARRDRSAAAQAAGQLGEALRIVHQHRPNSSAPKCDVACLRSWLESAVAAITDLAGPTHASSIARDVLDRLDRHEWRKAGLHGDFSHDQALVTASRVVVFDFDRAMRGDPWIDLGRFLASLELEVIRGAIDRETAEAVQQEFRAGYEGEADSASAQGDSFIAAQLLLRAPEPFRLRWTEWRRACARILERAAELAGSTSGAHR